MKQSKTMNSSLWLTAAWLLTTGFTLVGCGSDGGSAAVVAKRDEPRCEATSLSEASCADDLDDDCDGFVDCLDSDCEGASCGGDGLTCNAGACLMPGSDGLPPLPPIQNLNVTMHGDTAIIEFEPVEGARDYRIYAAPNPEDVLVGEDGELSVKDAIYRCAGDRPIRAREQDPAALFDATLGGTPDRPDVFRDYARSESEAVLGYVYLLPAAGRTAVYRLADPRIQGGYQNAEWVIPPYEEANAAEYVTDLAERDELLAQGYRDDGIAFYISDDGTRPIYRRSYEPNWLGSTAYFYTDGPEADARADDTGSLDFGERFRVLAEQVDGSVPLHRLTYFYNNSFDVLVAGEARYQRALHQGNQPFWTVTWPGVTETSTFVVEALDVGCPFSGGYIAGQSAPADDFNLPSITLDEARLASGEVFINGQHDESNRPKPIARAFVELTPEPDPEMDFFEGFDPGFEFEPFEIGTENNGVFIYRNGSWAADFSGCSPNLTLAPLLGQLGLGFTDYGSSCNVSIMPLTIQPKLATDSFLHVRMASDIPSTGRRYPQILITTTDILHPGDKPTLWDVVLHSRLGPLPAEMAEPGPEQSIIVQPFGGNPELQVEFCDQRGWGVNSQCPQANLYGGHANSYTETWEEDWTPVPVLGEIGGFDRPVQFDVFASTERVYVLVDGKPAGCAILPEGRMPAGDVTVAFRAVIYHSGIDEGVVPEDSGHQYLKRFSLTHTDRKLDDFGIDLATSAPEWDEVALPCGDRWYGGGG
jgi:hypothetical protein